MSLALLGPLVVLALVDSTSFGTLLIPIWFMLTAEVRPRRVLVFLGTVAAFYLVVGLALLAGADAVLREVPLDHPVVPVLQLVLGVVLFGWSFTIGRKPTTSGAAAPAAAHGATGTDAVGGAPATTAATATRQGGRLLRWRDRAVGAESGTTGYGALVGLALGAALVEVATMLPYLGAIGLLSSSGLRPLEQGLVLAVYCVVMVLPALVLLALRVLAASRIRPTLERVAAWMERTGAETTGWVVGIIGFLLARDALTRITDLTAILDALTIRLR